MEQDREHIFHLFNDIVPNYAMVHGFRERYDMMFPKRSPTDGFGLPDYAEARSNDPIIRFAMRLSTESSWQQLQNLFTFRSDHDVGDYEDLTLLALHGRHSLRMYVERADFIRVCSVRRLRTPFQLVPRENFAGYLSGPPDVPVFDQVAGEWRSIYEPESIHTLDDIKAQTDFCNEW